MPHKKKREKKEERRKDVLLTGHIPPTLAGVSVGRLGAKSLTRAIMVERTYYTHTIMGKGKGERGKGERGKGKGKRERGKGKRREKVCGKSFCTH